MGKPTNAPCYCPICGTPLQERVAVVPGGFDQVSGKPVPDTTMTVRACPRFMHPAWALVGKAWVEQ